MQPIQKQKLLPKREQDVDEGKNPVFLANWLFSQYLHKQHPFVMEITTIIDHYYVLGGGRLYTFFTTMVVKSPR